MHSEDSRGSVHPLPIARAATTTESDEVRLTDPTHLPSPKQLMLAAIDRIRGQVEADFITGALVITGTRLGEPAHHEQLGTFAHDPLDTMLMSLQCLYRQAFQMKEAQIAARQAQLEAMLQQSNGR